MINSRHIKLTLNEVQFLVLDIYTRMHAEHIQKIYYYLIGNTHMFEIILFNFAIKSLQQKKFIPISIKSLSFLWTCEEH